MVGTLVLQIRGLIRRRRMIVSLILPFRWTPYLVMVCDIRFGVMMGRTHIVLTSRFLLLWRQFMLMASRCSLGNTLYRLTVTLGIMYLLLLVTRTVTRTRLIVGIILLLVIELREIFRC